MDKDLAQVPKLPKDWKRWADKVAVRENFIFYHYKRGGAKTGYCTFCGKEVPISGHPYHNKEGRCIRCRHPVVFKALGRAGYFQTDKYYAYLVQRCRDGFVVREFRADRTYRKDTLPHSEPYWHEFRRSIYDRTGEIRSYYWGMYCQRETRWIAGSPCYYDWIDASLFQTEPEYYDSFVLCALKAPVIQRIYDKPLLASVLRQLLTHDACGGYEVNQLKERFYSKEEMEADRKATAEQEEQEKERQWQQQVMKCQEKLASCYNGSAESLIQFMHGYHFGEIRKAALGMVYEKLLEWPAGCAQTLEAAEMWKFFELCGSLVMYEPRPRREILTMVQTIVGGEAA